MLSSIPLLLHSHFGVKQSNLFASRVSFLANRRFLAMRAENADYMKEVQQDVATVQDHLSDSRSRSPKGIGQGGSVQAYNEKTFMEMYPQTEACICTFNMSWLSLRSATPELPLSSKKKAMLVQAYYTKPRECVQLLVRLDKDIDMKELQRLKAECAFPVCFPLEHLHAWWAGFATAVRNKDTDAVTEWENFMVTSVVQFKHMISDEIIWQSMQGRENIQTDFEVLRCTPLMSSQFWSFQGPG